MATLAQEVLNDAKPLLNDPSGIIYSDTVLLPLLKKAHRELQQKLARSGQQQLKELSALIVVLAGTVRLGDAAGLPTDLVYPIALKEKAQGASVDQYLDMDQSDWEETAVPGPELRMWAWREDEIKFPGASTNRDVLIKYRKGLTLITSVNTPIGILDSETYLASRTAALAAAVIGENYDRAGALNGDADNAFDVLIGTNTMNRQTMPVRRRRTRYRA
jgi:hypothetical protein